jgi:hypothetical protein
MLDQQKSLQQKSNQLTFFGKITLVYRDNNMTLMWIMIFKTLTFNVTSRIWLPLLFKQHIERTILRRVMKVSHAQFSHLNRWLLTWLWWGLVIVLYFSYINYWVRFFMCLTGEHYTITTSINAIHRTPIGGYRVKLSIRSKNIQIQWTTWQGLT